jgi:hypothetical protein
MIGNGDYSHSQGELYPSGQATATGHYPLADRRAPQQFRGTRIPRLHDGRPSPHTAGRARVGLPDRRRLGELYEQRGETARAIERYSQFVTLWKDADPELAPAVREIRSRIERLAQRSQ